jgi:hypothetical protein
LANAGVAMQRTVAFFAPIPAGSGSLAATVPDSLLPAERRRRRGAAADSVCYPALAGADTLLVHRGGRTGRRVQEWVKWGERDELVMVSEEERRRERVWRGCEWRGG